MKLENWRVRLSRCWVAAQPYGVLAWLVGVVALSLRLLVSLGGVHMLTRRRQPISQDLTARVTRLAERLGLTLPLRVYLSDCVREAILVGVWRPMVLLPAAWVLEMTPESLEAVIAHELAHLRRWDQWTNLLQRLVETLLFYHPAVWWLSRSVSYQREMSADNLAVAVTGQPVTYASVLEFVGRKRLGLPAPQFGTAMGGTKMALLSRVRNVLGIAPAEQRLRWWPAGLVALLLPLALWTVSPGNAGNPQEGTTAEAKATDAPVEKRRATGSLANGLLWSLSRPTRCEAESGHQPVRRIPRHQFLPS